LVSPSASSASYYVDPALGSDSFNGRSQTFVSGLNGPWEHIPGADGFTGSGWVRLTAGDTITVKGGGIINARIVVDGTFYNNGSSNNLIIIQSGHLVGWGNSRAVIDGGSVRAHGFYLGQYSTAISYIRINGFEIRNMASTKSASGIFMPNADYCEISNNLIYSIPGPSDEDRGYGIEVEGGCSYGTIEKNVIHNVGAKGIELNAGVNSFIVEHNFLYDTEDHGMVISGTYNIVRNNIVMHCGTIYKPAYGIKCDSGTLAAEYNDIYNNIIWRGKSGLGILNGRYNNFFNNIVYFCGFDDMRTYSGNDFVAFAMYDDGTSSFKVEGNKIKNNILYYNGKDPDGNGVQFWFSSNIGNNNIFMDNLLYYDAGTTNTLVRYKNGASYEYRSVSWLESSSGFASVAAGNIASNNIAADPKLKGGSGLEVINSAPTGFNTSWQPNKDGFELTANSPVGALQGSKDLESLYSLDIAGNLRVNYSIGPFEFTVGSQATSPNSPTGLRIIQGP
jgi:hypothetical protein